MPGGCKKEYFESEFSGAKTELAELRSGKLRWEEIQRDLTAQVTELKEEVRSTTEQKDIVTRDYAAAQARIEKLTMLANDKSTQLEQATETADRQSRELRESEESMQDLERQLSDLNERITTKDERLAAKDTLVLRITDDLNQALSEAMLKTAALDAANLTVANLEQQVRERAAQQQTTESQLSQVTEQLNTLAFRVKRMADSTARGKLF